MAINKNIVRENIDIDGRTSTFNVYMQNGLNVDIPAKSKNKKDMGIKDRANAVYEQVTKAVEDIYENPENPKNYDSCKEASRELVLVIIDDTFKIQLLMSIAKHDFYIHTHSLNVAIYSVSLGLYLGLKKKTLRELAESALLHDLGITKIEKSIINKNGSLSIQEFESVREHSSFGYEISENIGVTSKNILDGIKYHHEKIDGSGYPDGLKGSEIPLFARIIGICDIFDALSSQRVYKDALSTFEALKLMKLEMKNEIDMDILNTLIKMFR